MGTTRLYSSVHFHSFHALIRIFRHAPGNIRGGQVPEKSPYNKSLGNVPLYRRPNLITADPKFGQSLCCKFFCRRESSLGLLPSFSNRNCTLNMFEWNLRAGKDELPAEIKLGGKIGQLFYLFLKVVFNLKQDQPVQIAIIPWHVDLI